MEQDRIKQLESDLAMADEINGRLIRMLKDIYKTVTQYADEDQLAEDALLHILEILDSESNLTLD